jgi:hypothetical protein
LGRLTLLPSVAVLGLLTLRGLLTLLISLALRCCFRLLERLFRLLSRLMLLGALLMLLVIILRRA